MHIIEFLQWRGYNPNVPRTTRGKTPFPSRIASCNDTCCATYQEKNLSNYRQFAALTTLPRKNKSSQKDILSRFPKSKGNNLSIICQNCSTIIYSVPYFNGYVISNCQIFPDDKTGITKYAVAPEMEKGMNFERVTSSEYATEDNDISICAKSESRKDQYMYSNSLRRNVHGLVKIGENKDHSRLDKSCSTLQR